MGKEGNLRKKRSSNDPPLSNRLCLETYIGADSVVLSLHDNCMHDHISQFSSFIVVWGPSLVHVLAIYIPLLH